MSIHEFLVGPKRTALEPGELVVEAVVALPKGAQEFLKVGVRNAMVIAIANLALVVDHGALKVAAGSVGPTVIRARGAEQWAEANGGVYADADGVRPARREPRYGPSTTIGRPLRTGGGPSR